MSTDTDKRHARQAVEQAHNGVHARACKHAPAGTDMFAGNPDDAKTDRQANTQMCNDADG